MTSRAIQRDTNGRVLITSGQNMGVAVSSLPLAIKVLVYLRIKICHLKSTKALLFPGAKDLPR